jgi:hypothetical protein
MLYLRADLVASSIYVAGRGAEDYAVCAPKFFNPKLARKSDIKSVVFQPRVSNKNLSHRGF